MDQNLEQLAAAARGGCLRSYEQIVVTLQDRVFTFVVQIVRNDEDAEDITQETFIKAYRGLQAFDGRARFTTWIYTIARNTAINHLRRRKPQEQLELHEDTLSQPPPPERRDYEESVWTVARQLKPAFYQFLWLFYAEGFSIQEIARVCGCTSVSVRVGLHRARAALRRKLEHSREP